MKVKSPLNNTLLAAAVLGSMAWHSAASAADVFYSGRATGVNATLVVNGITKKLLLAKNDMSCQGLPDEETVSGVDNKPPLGIKVRTITTFTQGVDGVATARAATEDLALDVPGLKLNAAVAEAFAEVRCVNGQQQSSGNSNVGTVTINGQTHNIGASPNQSITIPNVGTVIFNEQVKWKREFKVYAIHVKLNNPSFPASGDIYVSEAKAKISSCAAVCTPP